jgi:predicted lipoprotein with Yx(FWY)xxD motif
MKENPTMKTKHLIQAAALALSALALNAAMAHGAGKPQHGGIVQVANDVNFELVVDANGATIYLVDHDEPMLSTGISGKLTVLQGDRKSEAEVKAAGDNKLRAEGIKIASGAKVVAVLNNVEGKTATVRFTVR